MNKNGTIVLLTLTVLSCGGREKAMAPVLSDELDTLSYCIGLDLGDYLVRTNQRLDIRDSLDLETVVAGMRASLARKPMLNSDSRFEWLRRYFSETLPQKNQRSAEAFLKRAEKEKKQSVASGSGLVYEIVKPGNGRHPDGRDVVCVMYEGRRMDGSLYETTYDTGEFSERPVDSFIQGVQEGLSLIGEGGIIKLWIPPSLAFGREGNDYVGPNQALYYYLELVYIE